MEKTYRIVRLESENIKRLKAVSIAPDGNVVEITGENGAGKTSLLDSIYWTLSGTSYIQSDPIRQGEEKARVMLDLGSIMVTRKFSRQDDGTFTTSVVIENDEGMRAQSPQKLLDTIVGQLTFDPLAFTRMKPKDQFDALKQFVSGFDFEENAKQRKRLFDERTDSNRRARDARAQADGITVADDVPDEPIDDMPLVAELQSASEHNADIERRRSQRTAVELKIQALLQENRQREARMDALQREIEKERNIFRETVDQIAAEQARLDAAPALPEMIDPMAVRRRIDAARATNTLVARKTERNGLLAKAITCEAESRRMTGDIEALDEAKAAAIAAAKMPVDGIGFGDDVITLNGFPFDQASHAEQLRASIGLTMAANPKLRIMLVRDGSLLDEKSMQVVAEMADKHNFQVWLESVSSDRPGAIVIEDGAVRGAIQQAAE